MGGEAVTARPPVVASQARIAILMAVRNGAAHLREQLDSIAAQTHANWHILASDDGSQDHSRVILSEFAARDGGLTVLEGPQAGAAANFLFLIRQLGQYGDDEGWTAFSDQDDVWYPARLERGLAALSHVPETTPALFCSRLTITDPQLRPLRRSPSRPRPPGFCNALVQNIAAGNTILLNLAATRLIVAAAVEVQDLVIHDWWIYQIVSGVGGVVVHDDAALVLYRQHSGNQIGANDTLRARGKRMMMVLRGQFRLWNDINIRALQGSAHRFTPENQALLEGFARMRDSRFCLHRLWRLWRLGLYRQHLPGSCALWLSALLRRL
ncbi:Glycosyl transferase family 2 [Roseovarius azorensis]|uniref:Glycosyl transferase family 2 n=1 Tax=Roseovarius azorensis TaxID=1287727 RepID=A0A1H7PXB0_9RHOB|nr:glycosyltransferase [Roseovarius azorensis]SEL40372.1 Glycosyl transferase family 2 [Roseovarius azorensis]